MKRFKILWYVIGVVLLAMLIATATISRTVAGVEQPTIAGSLFIPIIVADVAPTPGPTKGLYGKATVNGAPLTGQLLELFRDEGAQSFTQATTTTDAQGMYSFTDIPDLAPGHSYYVLYENSSDPSRLGAWLTGRIDNYTSGTEVHMGDFDVANVELVAPDPGATVSVPTTFRWSLRAATPNDSYSLALFEPTDFDPFFVGEPVGYANSYTLSALPAGFSTGTQYAWSVYIFAPDGGVGLAHWAYYVMFTSSQAPNDESAIGKMAVSHLGQSGLFRQLERHISGE